MNTQNTERSLWRRVFGRSILAMVFGSFFEKKSNAASIIAIMLVATICYVVAFKDQLDYMAYLLNLVFVVVGYYFGAKQEVVTQENE